MIEKIKKWYSDLTRGDEINYSLSDTQFFWITTVWLMLFPFVTYAVFYLDKASWQEYLVFIALELVVLAFKYAKYINVRHGATSVELSQKEKTKEVDNG